MQTTEIKGGLFLRPMRIMQQSKIVEVKDGITTIPPPSGDWPGQFFSPDKNSLGDGNSHQSRQYSRVIVGSAAEG